MSELYIRVIPQNPEWQPTADNVADGGQVLPLLPNSADTLVIITSRTRRVELDGAEWISLGSCGPPIASRCSPPCWGPQRTLRADGDAQSAGHYRDRAEAEFAELGVLAVSPF